MPLTVTLAATSQPTDTPSATFTVVTVTAVTTPTPSPLPPTLTPLPTPLPLAPQLTEELTFNLLTQQGGTIESIAVVGQTAFVGVGPCLAVVDITNPTDPHMLGQSEALPGLVRAVLVRDGRAYVGADNILLVFDVSNPNTPLPIAEMELPATITRLALTKQSLIAGLGTFPVVPGNEDTTGMVAAIDVSEASQPVLLSSVTIPQAVVGMAASDSVVYVGNPSSGTLYAIDISDPAHLGEPLPIPNIVTEHGDIPLARDMALFGDTLLIGGNYFVTLWNMADPIQPELLWQSELINGVVVEFAAEAGMVTLSTAGPPSEPVMLLPVTELKGLETASVSTKMVVQGDQLVTGLTSLDLYTLNGNEGVSSQASYHFPGIFSRSGPKDMAFAGENGLIVSQGEVTENESSRLSIVQLPELNFLGTTINKEIECDRCYVTWQLVAVDGDMAYLVEDGNWYILDISHPAQPTLVTAYTQADFGFFYDLYVADEQGYAVGYAGDRGYLWQMDLSDPHNVQVTEKIPWEGGAERVAVSENSLYLYTTYYTDHQVYEVHRFALEDGELVSTGSVEVANDINDMVLAGDVALASTTDGLIIVSAAASSGQPTIIAQLQIPGGLWELALMDDVLLATTAEFFGNGRLLAIDLQNLTQPHLIGSLSLPSGKAELAATDEGSVLVGNAAMGLMVLEVEGK